MPARNQMGGTSIRTSHQNVSSQSEVAGEALGRLKQRLYLHQVEPVRNDELELCATKTSR